MDPNLPNTTQTQPVETTAPQTPSMPEQPMQQTTPVEQPLQTPPPPSPKRGGAYLSKKTTVLILVLAAVALLLLFLAITPQTPKQTQVVTVTPQPSPIVETVLGFQPESSTQAAILKAKTQTYDVTINTHANTVNVVQLELAFDPAVLSNIKLTPGSFIAKPVELTKNIDYKNGRISYAVGIAPTDTGVKGMGTLATISFDFVPTATVSSTQISFLPKTEVGASGVNVSALKSATTATITVPFVTPVVTQIMLPKTTGTQTASPSSPVMKY